MKQSFGNDAPGFTVRYISEADLTGRRDRFTSTSAELSTLISQAINASGRVGPVRAAQ